MVADLAHGVDASQGIAVTRQDRFHIFAGKEALIQLPLVGAEPAEQHLSNWKEKACVPTTVGECQNERLIC